MVMLAYFSLKQGSRMTSYSLPIAEKVDVPPKRGHPFGSCLMGIEVHDACMFRSVLCHLQLGGSGKK